MKHAKEDCKAADHVGKLKRLEKEGLATATQGLTAPKKVVKAMTIDMPHVGFVEAGGLGEGCEEGGSADIQGGLVDQGAGHTGTQEKVGW